MNELKDQLAQLQLPTKWGAAIARLYELKEKWPCGAQTVMGDAAGRGRMEVDFRTWDDHFTVWEGEQVTHRFTRDKITGGITVEQPETQHAEQKDQASV